MLRAVIGCRQNAYPQQLISRAFSAAVHAAAASHYEVLGVPLSATADEIKNAFRQRAKEVHPDLNADFTASDGEAFLRLVTAYEVLNDPQQRQLYDIANTSRMPGALKRAAAAAGAGAGAGAGVGREGSTGRDAADPFAWRYGLGEWAKQGPDSPAVHHDDSDSQLRRSVLSALATHRRELEHYMHAGLLKAFLGPKLEVLPGELPAAFEADERADPSLSHDLLHLVHGRALLGVVRMQQPLQLAGDTAAAAAALPEHSAQQPAAALMPGAAVAPGTAAHAPTAEGSPHDPTTGSAPQQTGGTQESSSPSTPTRHHRAALDKQQQQHQQQGHQQPSAATGGAEAAAAPGWDLLHSDSQASSVFAAAAAGSASAADGADEGDDDGKNDDVISEAEWQELLQQQHPLRGCYAWAPPPALQLPGAAETDAGPGSTHGMCSSKAGVEDGCSNVAGVMHLTLGGRAAKEAWQDAWQDAWQLSHTVLQQQAAGVSAPPPAAAGNGVAENGMAGHGSPVPDGDAVAWHEHSCGAVGSEWPTAAAGPWGDSVAQPSTSQQHQQHSGQQFGQQHEQPISQHESDNSTPAETSGRLYSGRQQQQHHHHHYQQQQQQQHRNNANQQQIAWLKQRRLWRWLRRPTADWAAADWSFDDSSEGVLVLQLLLLDNSVAAVAVRDDTQPAKPTKVYVGGIFVSAVLDDVVMEPLTGRLMCVLYRYYTPGVHHLCFYLPLKQGSRLLARLQRRWMPPSSTWLFPPRTDSHDTGGWVVEWEGHKYQNRHGWLHPAVYVLTAGCYSRDMELRRMGKGSSSSSIGQWYRAASDAGSRLSTAVGAWLHGKWVISMQPDRR